MKFTVAHTLTFSLGTPSRAVLHLLMTALPTPQQKIERWSIEMPGFAGAATFRDGFGNRAHLLSLVKPDAAIVAKVSGVVETADKAGVLGRLEYDPMPGMYRRATALTMADPLLVAGLTDGPDRIALLHDLMGRVHERVGGVRKPQGAVDAAPTPGPSPQGGGEQRQSQGLVGVAPAPGPSLRGGGEQRQSQGLVGVDAAPGPSPQGGGEQGQSQGLVGVAPSPGPSPQGGGEQGQLQGLVGVASALRSSTRGAGEKGQAAELADAFVGAVRSLDIPARHVTGYLFDEGAASFHAWAEAWDDRLGWIGFDPTLNVCPAEDYVRIASGLDAMGCLPIRAVPGWAEMPAETVEIVSDSSAKS